MAVEKGKKTIEASVKQLEIAEKKILATLEKKEASVPTITKYRPPNWFEKFLWFISSGTIIKDKINRLYRKLSGCGRKRCNTI